MSVFEKSKLHLDGIVDLSDNNLLKEARCANIDLDVDTQELRLEGQIVFDSNGVQGGHCGVKILILGNSKIELKDLKISHYSLFDEKRTYILESENYLLFVIVSAIVQFSLDTIIRRNSEHLKLLSPKNPGALEKLACYENQFFRMKNIQASCLFADVSKLLRHHYHNSTIFENERAIEQHLLSWLLQFTDAECDAIMSVLAAHYCIEQADVDCFI